MTPGIAAAAQAMRPPDACQLEWSLHVACLRAPAPPSFLCASEGHRRPPPDQPQEVVTGAYEAFRGAYHRHPLTGPRARALALVALLWASRRLHGTNETNERYLLSQLAARAAQKKERPALPATPTRLMNKAFGQLASAVVTPPERSCAGS